MRLIYVSSSKICSRTANSIQVMRMCQAFASGGHVATLLAREGEERQADEYAYYGVRRCFDIVKLPWPRVTGGGIVYGWRCSRFISEVPGVEAVYGRSVYGVLGALRLHLPCVYEVHSPPASRARFELERRVLRHQGLQRLVVISRALESAYVKLYPWFAPARIVVAPDGADLPEERIPPLPNWPGRIGVLQVGYVGHLYPGRGTDILVELAHRLPQMDFHAIGGTEGHVKRWTAKADSRNLFFHGFVPPAETERYRAMCDVLLLPYERRVAVAGGKGDTSAWMSPLKMFEYMASRKAIVASSLPALQEVLTHDSNALLVSPDDILAWEKALRDLEGDVGRRTRLADQAFRDLASTYTWAERARRVLPPAT